MNWAYWSSYIPSTHEFIVMGDTIAHDSYYELSDSILLANTDAIIAAHDETRGITDKELNMLIPGSEEFNLALQDITSKTSFLQGGTGFYDKSALNHIHGEYHFNPVFAKIKVGANFRVYQPDSKGSIFIDTNDVPIINREFGVYSGIEKDVLGESLKLSSTLRLDKNENFNFLFSPAMSVVYKPTEKDIIRLFNRSGKREGFASWCLLFYALWHQIHICGVDPRKDVFTTLS